MAHSKTDIEAIVASGNNRSGLRRFDPWLVVIAAALAGGFFLVDIGQRHKQQRV